MFLGEYQHTLDAKGRVSMPAKFRTGLRGNLVVGRGVDKCLNVYQADRYQELLEDLMGGIDLASTKREVRRWFTAGATEAVLDSAGRVTIPPVLRGYAGLDRDVAIIGNGDRIEIWDAEAWRSYGGEAAGRIESLAEELAAGGLL